jgi:hypothetical protein
MVQPETSAVIITDKPTVNFIVIFIWLPVLSFVHFRFKSAGILSALPRFRMMVIFATVSMAPKDAADRREQGDNAHQKKD